MKHLPNTITIGRIVLTPVVLGLFFSHTLALRALGLVLFLLLAWSDWVDGKLARKYQVSSRVGQFLDPLADKVLVLGTFITLPFLLPEVVPWWAVGLIALRDVVVTGLRVYADRMGWTLPTLYAAKVKTTIQLVFLIVVLTLYVLHQVPGVVGAWASWLLFGPVVQILLYGVVLVTLFTGIQYLYLMKKRSHESPA